MQWVGFVCMPMCPHMMCLMLLSLSPRCVCALGWVVCAFLPVCVCPHHVLFFVCARLGRSRVLLCGMVLVGSGTVGFGLSTTIGLCMAMRVVQGIGVGLGNVAGTYTYMCML